MLSCSRDFTNVDKDVVLKRHIQRTLYEVPYSIYRMISSMTIVAGPGLPWHVEDARMSGPARTEYSLIFVPEIDKEVHEIQKHLMYLMDNEERPKVWMSQLSTRPGSLFGKANKFTHNVILEHKDVADATLTRFIDCDLMGTARKIGDTVLKCLSRQMEKFNDPFKNKAFIFTLSLRGCSEYETFKWINDYFLSKLNARIDFEKSGVLNCHLPKRQITTDPNTRKSAKGGRSLGIYEFNEILYIEKGRLDGFYPIFYNDDGGPMLTALVMYK